MLFVRLADPLSSRRVGSCCRTTGKNHELFLGWEGGRKVDSQLQSRIRLHVPKDSFLIYNCVPRKFKRQSSLNQLPTFDIFSTP